MKRLLFAIALGFTTLIGAVAPATAQSENAAATIVHACVDGVGQGSTTVRGEVKATYTVPAEGSHGRGPCLPAPGRVP
jgi:hypothetical protein